MEGVVMAGLEDLAKGRGVVVELGQRPTITKEDILACAKKLRELKPDKEWYWTAVEVHNATVARILEGHDIKNGQNKKMP